MLTEYTSREDFSEAVASAVSQAPGDASQAVLDAVLDAQDQLRASAERTEEQIAKFKNPDNDPRGPWKAENLSAGKYYAAGQFEITTPSGGTFKPPPGRYWRCNEETYQRWVSEGRIWFGKDGKGRPMLKKYLSEVGEGLTPNTWWEHEEYGSNKEASLELKELFSGKAVFDTAKPVKLVRRMLELFTDKDSLVLDFFAGSCTTAHAVLQLNRDDGGERRFVMVQLPEPTPEGSEARKAGFQTIADVGKERIRLAIAKLTGEAEGTLALDSREVPEDFGFRVFKLAESNYRPWSGVEQKDAKTYARQMAMFADPLVHGWKPDNVIWEVALKEGYAATSRIEKVSGTGRNTVWRVTDADKEQTFLISLADRLTPAFVEALALRKDDLFVCRDAALTDELAANLALQCQLMTI